MEKTEDTRDFKSLYLDEKKRADENWDKYIRQVAENKNSSERLKREFETLKSFTNESILRDILVIRDNLELAYQSSYGSSGLLLILREFDKVLNKHGVEVIDVVIGDEFDPRKMEGIDIRYIDNGKENNRVVEVIQQGYTLNERLLRPSKVIVSVGK